MPALAPIRREDLIRYLRQLGFEGPFTGGKHQYMVKRKTRLVIPNPHRGDIGRDFLIRILRQAGIQKDDWERL